jgi:transposase
MATLVQKTIRGHRYYYLVQTAWVNGRSRYVKQRYLGKAEDIGKLLTQSTAPVPSHSLNFEFGGTAALYSVAQQLQLVQIIDQHVPKRKQGLSVGQYALLAILNRCLAPTSKVQLAHWHAGTILYRLLPADPTQLRSQRFFDHMGELSLSAIQAIEKQIAQTLVQNWGVDPTSLVYDATNFFSYIDTRTPSKIALRGKNKARRIDLRQVSLGLLVSRDFHIPFFHDIYPGNRPDAVEFREVLRDLLARYAEVFPTPHNITLVFDKGNNSPESFRLLDHSRYHFIGSLVPTHHQDLLDIPRRSFVALKGQRLAGVMALRTTRKVYGAERTVVVTWNRTFYKAQVRGLLVTLNRCVRRLRRLQARLEQRRSQAHPKGKVPTVASVTRQVEAIRQARHMKQLLPTKVESTPKGVRLTFQTDQQEKRGLMKRLFGKTILFTDQTAWSTEDIVLGYRGQYKLEDGFRTLKDSEACCWWPMHHWTDQKIRVHGFFCVMALLLLSLLQRQLAQKGIDISITRLIRRLTEIEETALVYAPRPVVRGKSRARSAYVLTKMDTEQQALFDTLDLARYQHSSD